MTFRRPWPLLIALCWAAPGLAAEPEAAPSEQAADDARRGEARARYEEGVQAYTRGRFKDAVDHFLAADRLSPSAPLSFNIARAYDKLGDDSGALRWYRDYLRRSPNAANASDVAALIETFEAKLAKKGVQQITVLSTPTGATVSIDGANQGITPGTFDLAPGRHHVVLLLRGYTDVTSDVDLAPEHAQDLVLTLEQAAAPSAGAPAPVSSTAPAPSAPAPVPPPEAPPASAHAGFGPWPWVVLGAGAVTLGGALTFELLRQSSERAAEKDATQVGYADKLDQMQGRRTTARVLAGVGGGLVLVGGALLTIDLTRSHGPKRAAALAVAPSPDGLTATCTGRF